MNRQAADSSRAESGPTDSAPSLFTHEVRRDGRLVASLDAKQYRNGVTIETVVFPVTHAAGEPGLTRPFSFTSVDHAHRFADEALVAFEYLNCIVS